MPSKIYNNLQFRVSRRVCNVLYFDPHRKRKPTHALCNSAPPRHGRGAPLVLGRKLLRHPRHEIPKRPERRFAV